MLVILYALFANFCFAFVFGRYIGNKGVFVLSMLTFSIAIIQALLLGWAVFISNITSITKIWSFIYLGNCYVDFTLLTDSVSTIMVLVVLLISALVHCYSIGYMKGDPFIITFFSYLSLFTFFMLVLVTAANFIQLFFGWEGIGLCSYLLIGFWSTRLLANKSALKAIFINRIGDVFFILGISYTYYFFNSFNFFTIFSVVELYKDTILTCWNIDISIVNMICFCFVIAAVAKSAQIGLHTWLPDAMEGPTPVSALIHAATMVTAGIFLLNRVSTLLIYAHSVQVLIIILGGLTIVFAGSSALYQNDIKKIIAYSTCSQLGYMFLACGLLAFNASFFHLVTHAMFKALLFLSAGSIIHSLLGEQDIRRMGGLSAILPITYIAVFIGSIALTGLPFLAGFYSKETIIWSSLLLSPVTYFGFICGIFGAILTFFYSFRLLYVVFFSAPSISRVVVSTLCESEGFILLPLIILSIFSLVLGYFMSDFFVGLGNDIFSTVLINNLYTERNSLLGIYRSIFLVMVTCSTLFFAIIFLNSKKRTFLSLTLVSSSSIHGLFKFLVNKWYFDYCYNYIMLGGFTFSNFVFKIVDRTLDIYTGVLFSLLFYHIRLRLQVYTNFTQIYINSYIVFSLIGVLAIVACYS